jgi:hypothetical protein
MSDFYEDDEPIEKINAIFERGAHGITWPPTPVHAQVSTGLPCRYGTTHFVAIGTRCLCGAVKFGGPS